MSIVLAAACVLVAAGVWLPRQAARATLVLALVVAAVIWVVGEAFGMILAGGATDPNSGPLLALLALAYWPAKQRAGPRGTSGTVLTPVWILDVLAGVMLAVAGVSAARLVGARPWRRGTVVTDTDVGHLLMAIAMAGMLAAACGRCPAPPGWPFSAS